MHAKDTSSKPIANLHNICLLNTLPATKFSCRPGIVANTRPVPQQAGEALEQNERIVGRLPLARTGECHLLPVKLAACCSELFSDQFKSQQNQLYHKENLPQRSVRAVQAQGNRPLLQFDACDHIRSCLWNFEGGEVEFVAQRHYRYQKM